ncbi:hypothetical protein KBX37_05910 [Micromonospora sp. U56]|uniref:hypothetical protein n=1 Tax=Micromonospora sp. U56 TaxID=2824900 RepID=UPI001B35EAE6|nr:hypothetical protein [Micromonospora sp. U56]MBQ0892644.1 hypothetical protein [Micromonospora sp. U56]
MNAVVDNARRTVREAYERLRLLHRDFLAGRVPDIARDRAVQAAGEARRAYAEGLGFSGTIVVSQLGIVVSETLQASGLDMAEANRQAGIAAGI